MLGDPGSNRSLPSFLSFSVVFHRTTEMLSKTNFFGILWTLWSPNFSIEKFFTAFSLKFNDTHLLKIFFTAYSLKFNDTHLLNFFLLHIASNSMIVSRLTSDQSSA